MHTDVIAATIPEQEMPGISAVNRAGLRPNRVASALQFDAVGIAHELPHDVPTSTHVVVGTMQRVPVNRDVVFSGRPAGAFTITCLAGSDSATSQSISPWSGDTVTGPIHRSKCTV